MYSSRHHIQVTRGKYMKRGLRSYSDPDIQEMPWHVVNRKKINVTNHHVENKRPAVFDNENCGAEKAQMS